MTCKSFSPPRLPSDRRARLRLAALLVLALGAWTGGVIPLSAQAPPPPGASPTPRPRTAYVRFWNMVPQGKTNGQLQLLGSENKTLLTAPTFNYYATYSPVPPAAYSFSVRRPGGDASAPPLGRLAPVTLRADSYVTILASGPAEKPVVELINDTPDLKAPDDASGKLIVRQFIPDNRVSVIADRRVNSGEMVYGETRTLENLPTRAFPVLMLGAVAPGAPAKTWNAEVDFTGLSRRATLLIVGDAYGRFRPRLAYDGPNPNALANFKAEAAAAAAAAGSPSPTPGSPTPTPTR